MICLGKATALEALNDNTVEFKAYNEDNKNQHWKKGELDQNGYFTLKNVELEKFLTAFFDSENNDAIIEGKPNYKGLFHEQQECVYDFPWSSWCQCDTRRIMEYMFLLGGNFMPGTEKL